MDQKLKDSILNCRLFDKMTQEEASMLLACIRPRVRKLAKNDVANVAGDPFEGIGIILSGQAAVVKENSEGSRTILTILKPGDLFGEMAAFSGNGKWPATIIAQTACNIMYVPPEKIIAQCEKACQGHRKLLMNMLGILSSRAMALSRKLEYLSMKSMRGRIAAFLLEQYKMTGQKTFLLTMNRNELADFLNVSRPSLSREMCKMKEDGLIDFHRSSVQLKDIKMLSVAAE